jgi:molybdopterin-guanine dinucleotide biosynthesis protein B
MTDMRVIGLAGWSGAGKTTLLTKAIPMLVRQGLRVSTLKHAHHGFDIDHPGKDSYEHRHAGATEVLVASGRRWALMHELRLEPEPGLAELVRKLSPVDLLIVEGFKRDPHPKLEVHRGANGKPFLHPDNPTIVAVATDQPDLVTDRPAFHLDDIDRIVPLLLASAVPLGEGRDGAA